MGDRISIQFVKSAGTEMDTSIVLFSHWDGKFLLEEVDKYLDEIAEDKEVLGDHGPLSRLEPNTVMVDFIRWFTRKASRVTGNYYLGATESDGDNSDNGHWVINLETGKKEQI